MVYVNANVHVIFNFVVYLSVRTVTSCLVLIKICSYFKTKDK